MKKYFREILKNSTFLAINNVAVIAFDAVDAAMVGNYNTDHLAYIGVALIPFYFFYIAVSGLLDGYFIKMSNKIKIKSKEHIDFIFGDCFINTLFFGIIFTIINFFGEDVLKIIISDNDLIKNGGLYLRVLSFSTIFAYINYIYSKYFAIKAKPYIVTIVLIIANLLNILTNYMFIYGSFGIEAYGGLGAVYSTIIIRIIIFIMLYYLSKISIKSFQIKGILERTISTRKLGYSIFFATFAETMFYSLVKIFVANLGKTEIASFTIIMNMVNIVFSLASGEASAIGILTGYTYFDKSLHKLKTLLKAVSFSIFTLVFVLVLLLLTYKTEIIGLFTNDIFYINKIAPVYKYIALYFVADLVRMVLINIIRSYREVKDIVRNNVISYFGFSLFILYFMFNNINLNMGDILIFIILTSVFAVILNSFSFCKLYKKIKLNKNM